MIETPNVVEKVSNENRAEALAAVVWVNPDRMGGEPCFHGTRVPVKNLFDYLEGGDSLGDFLEGFPGVSRDQAVAVLKLAADRLLEKPNAT